MCKLKDPITVKLSHPSPQPPPPRGKSGNKQIDEVKVLVVKVGEGC